MSTHNWLNPKLEARAAGGAKADVGFLQSIPSRQANVWLFLGGML
jgi:hypothetical protein